MTSLETQIESLEDLSENDLLKIIGAYAIEEKSGSVNVDNVVAVEKLLVAGRQFISNPRVKRMICDVRDEVEKMSVKDIVTLVAAGLGIVGTIPTAIVAAVILIAKSGLKQYCAED